MVIISRASKYIVSSACFLFIFYLCIYPKEMLSAAKDGLLLWYNSVLPSVFPFLIISNILIEIGAVSKLGKVLEPMMRPLFNVPGCGAFAFIMGGVSGYPVGAKITADFREKGVISKAEAQRLISFCNNPGPLFVLGAVGTAILGSPNAGYFILITNYMSALLVGLIFRFYKSGDAIEISPHISQTQRKTPTIGGAMAVSVGRSIEVMLQIGGFILLFSAVIKILLLSHALALPQRALEPLFLMQGLSESLISPFICGLFEITNGIKMIGDTGALFPQKVIISGILVSFGGLSIYAQTASFISKTDISSAMCLFSKILQAVIHTLIMVSLYPFFSEFF